MQPSVWMGWMTKVFFCPYYSSVLPIHHGFRGYWWPGYECTVSSAPDGETPTTREYSGCPWFGTRIGSTCPGNAGRASSKPRCAGCSGSFLMHPSQEHVRSSHVCSLLYDLLFWMDSNLPCPPPGVFFSLHREEEPDFDADIAEDVGEECGRHGKVLHIRVIKESAGLVYVKMDSVESALKVQATLNHRWFAGKMITAEFVPEATYNAANGLR